MQVGIGQHVRGFDPGRALVLGGVKIPGSWGLKGRADGDVLLLATTDALLGAAGLGGLEEQFPEDDEGLGGLPGAALLAEARVKLEARRLLPVRIDAQVACERPALAPWRLDLCERLAALLGLTPESVNLKIQTLPATPQGAEGIAALVLATIREHA